MEKALGCSPLTGESGELIAGGVSIDSRTLQSGEIFVCIRGEKTDGHLYVLPALQAGAAAVVAERADEEIRRACREAGRPLFVVRDGNSALADLAAYHRGRLSGTVIGVTGSNGKTSFKEMLFGLGRNILGDTVSASEGNLNNHWGLPLSLLRARPDHRLIILEMGMNHPGEIGRLSRLARPHTAVIVSVGAAHIGFFRSVEEIARAKLEILEGMAPDSILFYHTGSPGLDLACALARERKTIVREFGFRPEDRVEADLNGIRFACENMSVENRHYHSVVMAENLLGALRLLESCGLPITRLVEAAAEIEPIAPRRFQVFRRRRAGENPRFLVDDSYNANEESFVVALRALRNLLPTGKPGLVAGEMAELGDRAPLAHRRVGEVAGENGYALCAVAGGEAAAEILAGYRALQPGGTAVQKQSASQLLEGLGSLLQRVNCDALLVKGSRSARMDLISDALKEEGYV